VVGLSLTEALLSLHLSQPAALQLRTAAVISLHQEEEVAEYDNDRYSVLHRMLPFTTALLIIVALYVGYIVFSRWKERRDLAENARREEIAGAKKSYEAYGSGEVKVLNFNISPGVLQKGDKASICYGVSNAKSVTIEPKPDETVWPSLARCVAASPKKTTKYVITAQDANGKTDTKDVTVIVQ
jgi:hypothetical protein